MKTVQTTTLLVALISLMTLPATAEEGGCLKYGAGGAVAGHFAGRHTMSGAAVGCGVGTWKRHKARDAERAQDRAYQEGLRNGEDRTGLDQRR
jgi:hypothetical protein